MAPETQDSGTIALVGPGTRDLIPSRWDLGPKIRDPYRVGGVGDREKSYVVMNYDPNYP